jgi:glycine/D-amino acid oxidase-like deaminating enzyme
VDPDLRAGPGTADWRYRGLSLWLDTVPGSLEPRPGLPGDTDADVAIVGAGYTGLWTAYYLAQADPTLRIAVLEREIAGFGASGRNGGWCSALFPASLAKVARLGGSGREDHGRGAAVALQRALHATVDEVARVTATEVIDCQFVKGGTVTLARSAAQLARAAAEVAEARRWGFGEEDLRSLSAAEATALVRAEGVLGGLYSPHCAAVHPARLARGLAEAVTRYGVRLYEQTPVTALRRGQVVTPRGRVRAEVVVRATEGYTAGLPGYRRALAPVYSLMLATEPLPDEFWRSAGLRRRETFTDLRHLIIYGQRTADGRFAFGGRGAPYHFGSRVRPGHDREPRVFAELRRVLVELFPALGEAEITHTWGGPLGVPRDWMASVGLDRRTGVGWAGGYVGDGVGTSNLAGRTLADLITGRDSPLVHLPWVGHRSRRWEPEPLRWLGMNAGLRLMAGADEEETRTGEPSRRARAFERFLGG